MAIRTITVVQDAVGFYLFDGNIGHPIGTTLAECRQTFANEYRDMFRRDIVRAAVRRLIASGLDPQTATAQQIKTAIESSGVDV